MAEAAAPPELWDTLSIVTTGFLVVAALVVSLLYAFRVIRHSKDPFRWVLLGVLVSLALVNIPPLIRFIDDDHAPVHPAFGWIARTLAGVLVLLVAKELFRDTWRDFCALMRVGRDSWRVVRRK